jgi:hypothetical protein
MATAPTAPPPIRTPTTILVPPSSGAAAVETGTESLLVVLVEGDAEVEGLVVEVLELENNTACESVILQ